MTKFPENQAIMKFTIHKSFASFFLILCVATTSWSQTRTINSSGNWSNSGNWVAGNIGGAVDNDDDVNMNDGINITVQNGETYTIATLNVSKEGSITIEYGGTLIITGLVDVDKEFTINVDGVLQAGSMSIAKQLTLNVGSTGDMTVSGDVGMAKEATMTIDGSVAVDGNFSAGKESAINVTSSGSMSVTGDFTPGTDTTIDGNGPISVGGTCTGSSTQCTDSQINSTLPISLKSFEISVIENTIELNWSTITEENFEYFIIQRADKGQNFETLTAIQGRGHSNSYTWSDEDPNVGINYYRLLSHDFDGYEEAFPAKVVVFSPKNTPLTFYPNPLLIGQQITISGNKSNQCKIEIFNINGESVFTGTTDKNQIKLDGLDQGLYIIKLDVNGLTKTSKLIIR